MSSPLRINPDALPHPAKFGRDAASAWLDRVTAMLRVPASEREAIRAELNEHLRERIRDLMLSGAAEHAATSQAISELGDAAVLARRYQEAIEPSSRRSLMHVGIATAATAALVFSGAALFQGGTPPTPPAPPASQSGGNALASSPTPGAASAESALNARLEEATRALVQARDVIAQQERELARARGEVESMQLRVRTAEERAAAMQTETFELQRQYQAEREDARRAHAALAEATRERDSAVSRLAAIEAAAISTPATPPATYTPEPNPARDFLRTLNIDMSNAGTLGAIMDQPAIRDAKVYLRNHRHAEWALVPPSALALPDRPLSLGEALDIINANSPAGAAMTPRAMPDGRIAIDTLEAWDRENRVLVIYDLSDLVARTMARARKSGPVPAYFPTLDQLRHVITDTVTPDIWQDNGGDIGALSVLDSSLVVTAPERSHHQIRFVIDQIRSSATRAEVPVLSDLPLVDVSLIDASRIAVEGRDIEVDRERKHEYPSPIESKGEGAK